MSKYFRIKPVWTFQKPHSVFHLFKSYDEAKEWCDYWGIYGKLEELPNNLARLELKNDKSKDKEKDQQK